MKKMVLIAGILVMSGFMYSMDTESENDNKGGDQSEKCPPRRQWSKRNKQRRRGRRRRITDMVIKDDGSKSTIESFLSKQGPTKSEVTKISTADFYGKKYYSAIGRNGHLLCGSNLEESKSAFMKRLSLSFDMSNLSGYNQ